MATSTMNSFGGPLWTSSKGPLAEKCSAGWKDFSNGGPGAFFTLQSKPFKNSVFRKVFGRNRQGELSDAMKANMSVNALARQREQRDDAAFDSP